MGCKVCHKVTTLHEDFAGGLCTECQEKKRAEAKIRAAGSTFYVCKMCDKAFDVEGVFVYCPDCAAPLFNIMVEKISRKGA
jgi:hypothetical protein